MNRTMKLVASITLTGATLGQMMPADAAGPADPCRDGVVYVVTNPSGPNAVEAFLRDGATGRLTRKGRYLTGGQGDAALAGAQSHAVVSDGEHLYVVNPGSDDVSAFEIKHDGSLRLLGRTASQGRRPVSLTLHDHLLYVANEGNIPFVPPALPGSYSGFRIKANGSLEPIPGSTVAVPAGENPIEIMFNRDGSRVVAARVSSGIVDSFHVDGNGLLTRNAQLPGQAGPFGGAVSPTKPDQFFLTLVSPLAPAVSSYHLPDTGAATVLSTDNNPGLVDPCWAAASPDGKHVWASAAIPRSLTLYDVTDSGSLVVKSANVPPDSGPASLDIALDPSGRFLYRLRGLSVPTPGSTPIVPQLDTYKVTGLDTNGGLDLVQTLTLPADLSTASVTGVIALDL